MARRAGRVSDVDRERALRRYADLTYALGLGASAALRVVRDIQRAVLRSYRAGRDPRLPMAEAFEGLIGPLRQGIVYARLRGIDREAKELQALPKSQQPQIGASFATSAAYRRATRFLVRRLRIKPDELSAINLQALPVSETVVGDALERAQDEIMKEIARITSEGLHTRDAVRALNEKLASMGLTPRRANWAETVFRTNTQLGYVAGNQEVWSDPDIREIHWGFKYVAVGDDRTRPGHLAIDGVTLPKEHPFWQTNMPPNGWNCRCQVIPIYRPRKQVEPPESATIRRADGSRQEIRIGADEGFEFNAASVLPPVVKAPAA